MEQMDVIQWIWNLIFHKILLFFGLVFFDIKKQYFYVYSGVLMKEHEEKKAAEEDQGDANG